MRGDTNGYREKRRGGVLLKREGVARANLIQDTRNGEIKGGGRGKQTRLGSEKVENREADKQQRPEQAKKKEMMKGRERNRLSGEQRVKRKSADQQLKE